MTATEHAYRRAKERMSWNHDALDRMMPKAFEEGLKHSETKGNLKKFITGKWFGHKHANNIRIHGEVVYFFSDETLLTLYQLPRNLIKYVKLCQPHLS